VTRQLSLPALVAILVVGCTIFTNYKNYTLKVPETRAWPATGVARFEATTENGDIAVTAAAADSIAAEITKSVTGKDSADAAAHLKDITVSEEVTGTTITLKAAMPRSTARNYGAAFDVTAPSGLAVDLKTTNGKVTVTGAMSEVEVRTTNGGVDTDGTRGRLTVESTNGTVSVTDHQGSAEIGTTNGGINCRLALPEASQQADLETTNGGVTLALPADAAVTFDATTTNGTVSVEGFASVDYTTNEGTHKAGSIGGGGADVDIGTSNGNVTIRAE
jgi:DUF4097 and DUF4098 domain-containing protein YvlB